MSGSDFPFDIPLFVSSRVILQTITESQHNKNLSDTLLAAMLTHHAYIYFLIKFEEVFSFYLTVSLLSHNPATEMYVRAVDANCGLHHFA